MCLKQPSLIATPPTQTQRDLEIAVGNAEASLRSCNQEEQEQLEFLIRFAKACIAKKKVRESCRVHEVYGVYVWSTKGTWYAWWYTQGGIDADGKGEEGRAAAGLSPSTPALKPQQLIMPAVTPSSTCGPEQEHKEQQEDKVEGNGG